MVASVTSFDVFLRHVSQYVEYADLQVLYKSLGNDICSSVRSCSLTPLDTVLTSNCEYQCPCEETGCEVIYFDSHQHYKGQPVDVCGLEILLFC